MKLSISLTQPQTQQKTCLIIGVYEGGELTPAAQSVDKSTHGWLSKLIRQGVIKGNVGQIVPLFPDIKQGFEQILIIGCGKSSSLTPAIFRKLIVSSTQSLVTYQCKQATCYLTELKVKDKPLAWKIKQIAEAALDGIYRFDAFKSDKYTAIHLNNLIIHLPDKKQQKACEAALAQGVAIASGVAFTKNLANLPSNICTPSYLAEEAKQLAKSYSSIKVKVLGEKDMSKLGMGALLAVSQGSAEEAKLICIEYNGAAKKVRPVALVGKGITFDTGGNSLKSPDNMVGMKYDMCGAASVFGTILAAAKLKLPVNIVGVIPCVENMPGGTAYKPEDILKSMSASP